MTEGGTYGLRRFEDARWSAGGQVPMWRHFAAADLVRREPVLDVGGGDGLLLRLLAEKGMTELAMVDISGVAIARAREAGIHATQHDVADRLPFAAREFGCATLVDVLEHMYDPVGLLKEAGRVAAEVVVVVPNFHYWRERVQMLVGRVPFQSKPRRGHVHWFNMHLLDEVVAAAGLREESRILGNFTRLSPVGSWLAKARPSVFATAFAVRLIPDGR